MSAKKDKRAISPVIATVLLIVVAIALFLLIFFWIRGFQKEAILKYGTPVETVCNNVKYSVTYSGGVVPKVVVTNIGTVVISKAEVFRITNKGTEKVGEIKSIYPASSGTFQGGDLQCQKIKIIPYLLGKTNAGAYREHACNNQAKTIPC